MLGASTLATALSGKGKIADVASFALATGLHIVIDKPGTKIPMCILGDRARKQADVVAVEAALAEGKPRPERARHACGIAHALTPEDKQHVRALVARLEKRHGTVNLGIKLGASRVVVVDVDTAAEEHAFKGWLAAHGALGAQMTVRSPGQFQDASAAGGEPRWVHKDGGHYWFEVPAGVELPTDHGAGVLKIAHGNSAFTVMWANRQVLIPPSSRPEGAYVFTGAPIVALPAALLDAIVEDSALRANTAVLRLAELDERVSDGPSTVDEWDARTPWSDLLEPDGWIDTGKIDNCGCPIWTAPGEHASYKSATAHDPGCARFDTATGWGPLHVWTDSPPEALYGQRTLTKLSYLALLSGRERAEVALGLGLIEPSPEVEFDTEMTTPAPAEPVVGSDMFESPALIGETDPELTSENPILSDTADNSDKTVNAVIETKTTGLVIQRMSDMRNRGQRAPHLISGWLGHGGVSRVIGKSNEGKTFVAVDIAASIATGLSWHGQAVEQGKVIYVNYEDHDGLQDRFLAWDELHDGALTANEDNLLLVDPISEVFISAGDEHSKRRRHQLAEQIRGENVRMVIFDTQSMASMGADENDATEMMTKVVGWLKAAAAHVPNCQLVLIHHRGHTGEHGRGSTAVYAALDTELTVERPDKDKPEITVGVSKQRAMPFAPHMVIRLASVAVPGLELPQAAIEAGDPFDAPTDRATPNVELTHVPDSVGLHVLLGSLIRDTLDGPEEGWTEAAARGLLAGRQRGGRDIDAAAKRQAWKRLRERGWIEPHEDGKVGRWHITDVGGSSLDQALESAD